MLLNQNQDVIAELSEKLFRSFMAITQEFAEQRKLTPDDIMLAMAIFVMKVSAAVQLMVDDKEKEEVVDYLLANLEKTRNFHLEDN